MAGDPQPPAGGLKFKRQVPLDGYILDFVCFEEKLILEVDGGQHAENVRDATRDAHFGAQGFRTIRFWNDEVERNIDGVCAPFPSPLVGEGGRAEGEVG